MCQSHQQLWRKNACTSLPMSAARYKLRLSSLPVTEFLHNFNVHLQLLSASSSKHQEGGTGSEYSHFAALLEHTVVAIEKLLARKRKKKPLAASTAPLEVIHEHPVLISALALLLHHSPQLASERYSTWCCFFVSDFECER